MQAGRTPLDLAREEKNYITCSYLEDCMKLGIGLHKVNFDMCAF